MRVLVRQLQETATSTGFADLSALASIAGAMWLVYKCFRIIAGFDTLPNLWVF